MGNSLDAIAGEDVVERRGVRLKGRGLVKFGARNSKWSDGKLAGQSERSHSSLVMIPANQNC